jgi:hypothetical protein
MAQYHILFGAIGVGLGDAVTVLRTAYQSDLQVEDVEDHLKSNGETMERLREYARDLPDDENYRPNMEEIIFYLPRPVVFDLWKRSAEHCLTLLKESNRPIRVLSGHLVYYSRRRNELYSAVDSEMLLKVCSPQSVTLLIDDIWDVFSRLRTQRWLFCDERIGSFIEDICNEEGQEPNGEGEDSTELSAELNQFLVVLWKLQCFHKLLTWRCLEAVMAEHLARTLGRVRFSLFGTKQRHGILKAWLEAESPHAVYVSHPISEARRQFDDGKWPAFVQEVNGLPELLLSKDIVGISPTSIDEFRLAKEEGLQTLSGNLLPRWPLAAPTEALLYKYPMGTTECDYSRILRPELYDHVKGKLEPLGEQQEHERAVNMLRAGAVSLRATISDQVSARDHLLVVSSKAVLVYRPLYGGRESFSDGVAAEVRHWRELFLSGVPTRVGFVHFAEDIEASIQARIRSGEEPLAENFRSELVSIVCQNTNLDVQRARSLVLHGQHPPRGILEEPGFDQARLMDRYNELKRDLKVAKLRDLLTNARGRTQIGTDCIWDFGNAREFRTCLDDVAGFLKGDRRPTERWQDHVDTYLPDDLLGVH